MIRNTELTIGWLYSKTMNLYGDRGNILAFKYRAQVRGIEVKIRNIEVGDKFDEKTIDLAFFGGGQDKEQRVVAKDLQSKSKNINNFYKMDKPMLSICGGYQLLGNFFQTCNGDKITGIGVLDVNTFGSKERMIGNVKIKNNLFDGVLVGFENHSGRTFLEDKDSSLGEVLKGGGNNGVDNTEGIVSKNFVGTYLHGPFLPKNPKMTDWFLEKALEIKYNKPTKLKKISNNLEEKAKDYVLENY